MSWIGICILIGAIGCLIGSVMATFIFLKMRGPKDIPDQQQQQAAPQQEERNTEQDKVGIEDISEKEFENFLRDLGDYNVTEHELQGLVDMYNSERFELDKRFKILDKAKSDLAQKGIPEDQLGQMIATEKANMEMRDRHLRTVKSLIKKLRFLEPDFVDDQEDYDERIQQRVSGSLGMIGM